MSDNVHSSCADSIVSKLMYNTQSTEAPGPIVHHITPEVYMVEV